MATTNKNFIVKNGLNASGDITTSGYLKSTNSSGDEGGEIFLNKAVTNTTLNGGVTIDVYQDKLRFFEQGGTARGFYIDITTGSGSASTNLAGGSGTVTSVAMTVPTGLSISGSPITGSGTLALSLAAGYSIPTTANQTNWSTAYGWGNHATAGYASSSHNHSLDSLSNVTITTNAAGEILKWSGTAWINNTLAEAGISATGHTHAASDVTSGTFDIARIPTGTSGTTVALGNHTHSYQPLDTELTSIAALANSTGYLYNNGTGTFSYAVPTSVSGNAGTVTNGVYTTDTGTVTNTMLAGSIANAKLLNSSITINGSAISLGGSVTTPDTNTTYTFASGTTNGAFSVTPSGSVAQSVAIYGLGTAAYTASSAYATSGHTHAAITFTTTGGAGAGITYDGSTVRTIDYSTIGAVSNSAVQTVGGAKTFSANMSTAGITATGNISTSASLTRSALAGGGSTTATFDNSGNLVRTASSARYKQDILSAEYVYEDILSLEPKTFRLKNEVEDDSNARTYAGFIAEELDQLDSLKVFVNYLPQEDGSKIPDGIQYGEMVSALVSAIKHQDELIKSLTSRIDTLENR